MKPVKYIFIPSIREARLIFDCNFELDEYGYYIGKFNDFKIIVSGVSKTNISIVATIYFLKQKPSVAYLVGIAGCYRYSGVGIGDLVSIRYDYFVDEGMVFEDKIVFLSEMGFPVCKDNRVSFCEYEKLKIVDSNTVSFLSSSDDIARLYYEKTGASIENMEGASFGLVCSVFGVKSYHIRGVSNYCGNRNEQSWDIKKSTSSLKNFFLQSNPDI